MSTREEGWNQGSVDISKIQIIWKSFGPFDECGGGWVISIFGFWESAVYAGQYQLYWVTVMELFWKTRNKITLVLLLLLLQDLLGCGHWAVHDGGPVVGLRLERGWRALLMLQVLFLLLRLKFIRDGRTVVMSTQVSWLTIDITTHWAFCVPFATCAPFFTVLTVLWPSAFNSFFCVPVPPLLLAIFHPIILSLFISYFSFYVIARWCVCIYLLPLGLAFVINLTIIL